VREQGIRCVVDLRAEAAENSTEVTGQELCYLRLPIAEGDAAGQQELDQVTSWIDEHTGQHGPVLVHCREGRGRSPMVVLAYLVSSGFPLHEAYRLVTREHPGVAINTPQQEALVLFAESRRTTEGDGT
jgi:protein-tyrosine phosphatase